VATILMIFPQMVTERPLPGGGTPDTGGAERRSGPFRLNLTTAYDFLLVVYCNYVSILHRFGGSTAYQHNIRNFYTCRNLTSSEIGDGV